MKASFALIFIAYLGFAFPSTQARPSRTTYGRNFPSPSSSSTNNRKLPNVDPGNPLFLTPYIQSGQINEAQQMASVQGVLDGVTSYSGLITVDNKTGANMFFWSVNALHNADTAPLVLWLQGGPGASSMFGLFVENGPFQVDKNLKITQRAVAWSNAYNMIYIDNPVGTGYSFVTYDSGYVTNEDQVAQHLYDFFVQYYTLFPTQRSNPIFLAGESYAGKYVPAFGAKLAQMEKIYEKTEQDNPIAKLAGILVGNGFTDPETMLPMGGDHLYSLGLLDEEQREYFNGQYEIAVDDIRNGLFKDAFDIDDRMINADFFPYPSYFTNVSGCTDYFNCLLCRESPPEFGYYVNYLQLNETRASIHVGTLHYNDEAPKVEKALINDVMDTCKPQVEYLLTQTQVPVLYYSGNLDLIVPTVATDNFLRSLQWPNHETWIHANRKVWTNQDGDAVSYSVSVGQLTFEVIRNAGHMVPYDQPQVTFKMVTDFISKALS